jgi:TonB-linked SusC/RagA family outer membrane protein
MTGIVYPMRMLLLMLLLAVVNICYAQRVINGQVLSKSDQSPVAGATILIKGSKTGTSSGIDGRFGIKAKEGDILVISGIGVVKQEISIGTDNNIIINVATDSKNLNELVVTATGIKKESKKLGYAIQTIDASTLTQAREPDPINSLKGNAAGLTININQEIGHEPDVILRGENDPNNRPMFVVDGVPLSSDTYNISPDDIESYTILKGPSAAALYGFQGKNGAVIINTKKGSRNKRGFSIDFNSSTQFNKGFIAAPKTQNEYGAGEYGEYAFGGGGLNGAKGLNDVDFDIWGPQLKGQLIPQYDGTYTPNQTYTTTFPNGDIFTGNIMPTPWVARGKNNLENYLQTGVLSSNSVAAGSSSEKTDVRFSLANTYQSGIVPNTQLNNVNVTGSIIQRFSKHLTLSSYIDFSRQSTPNLPDVTYGANSPIYNLSLWGGADFNVKDLKNYWLPGQVGIQQKNNEYYRYNNPYFVSYEWLHGHYQNNVNGYLALNYKVNDNIDLMVRPSINTYDMLNTEKLPWSASCYGRYTLRQGDYREDRRDLFESNVEAQARYHKDRILGFLDLQGLIGGNVRSFRFNSNFTSTNYLNAPGIYAFSNTVNPLIGTSFSSEMKVLSAYYSADIGYKSYITANITGRVDKSSSLPANNDAYFYPSFNVATVVSEYVQLPTIISFLKFRASYAESKDGGTSPLYTPPALSLEGETYGYYFPSAYGGPNYQFSQPYTLSPTYNNQGSASFTNQTVSPTVKSADRKADEFGMDLRFLRNTIGLDVTRYHYLNTGIANQGTSPASGYTSYLTNGNTYTNDGWEVTVNATPFKDPKGFGWNITANWFTYIRKWVSDANPDNYSYNGTRIDLVYGNAFVRTPDGKFVIDPGSGLQVIDAQTGSSALKVFGHSDPDWQWGVVNNLSYKNFSLRFQFDGSVGGVIEDGVRKKGLEGGTQIESVEGAYGAARPNDATGGSYVGQGVNLTGAAILLDPKTEQITNIKDLTETPNTTKSNVQDYVYNNATIPDLDIVKKTYAKLREVAITYVIPQRVFGKTNFVQRATFSIVGRNLLYFFPSRYKDFDVDQYQTLQPGAATLNPNSSVAAGAYTAGLQTPTTRSYGFNLNISF